MTFPDGGEHGITVFVVPAVKVLIFVKDDDDGLVATQLQDKLEDATPSRKVLPTWTPAELRCQSLRFSAFGADARGEQTVNSPRNADAVIF